MSNVLKGYFVSVDDDSRVVDIDELLKLRLKEEEDRRARLNAISEENGFSDEFVEGLPIQNIDALLGDDEAGVVIGDVGAEDASYMQASNEELEALNSQIAVANEELQRINAEIQNAYDEANANIEAMKEAAYEEARNEGYQAGYNEGIASVESMKQELMEQAASMDEEYERHLMEAEPMLVDTITDIYEHIFRIDMSMYQGIVKNLLIDTINGNNDARNIIVHISKDDYAMIMSEKEDILTETGMQADNVEFVQDATLKSTDCIIETDNGVFDCSLETELKELKRKLMLLAYH